MEGKKSGGIIGVILIIVIAIIIGMASCGGNSSGSRGDGKKTCRNCGREKPLSSIGYCSICQEGFDDWQRNH